MPNFNDDETVIWEDLFWLLTNILRIRHQSCKVVVSSVWNHSFETSSHLCEEGGAPSPYSCCSYIRGQNCSFGWNKYFLRNFKHIFWAPYNTRLIICCIASKKWIFKKHIVWFGPKWNKITHLPKNGDTYCEYLLKL